MTPWGGATIGEFSLGPRGAGPLGAILKQTTARHVP